MGHFSWTSHCLTQQVFSTPLICQQNFYCLYFSLGRLFNAPSLTASIRDSVSCISSSVNGTLIVAFDCLSRCVCQASSLLLVESTSPLSTASLDASVGLHPCSQWNHHRHFLLRLSGHLLGCQHSLHHLAKFTSPSTFPWTDSSTPAPIASIDDFVGLEVYLDTNPPQSLGSPLLVNLHRDNHLLYFLAKITSPLLHLHVDKIPRRPTSWASLYTLHDLILRSSFSNTIWG